MSSNCSLFSLFSSSSITPIDSGGAAGQASDIAIHAKEILEIRKRLNNIYVHHTKKDLAAIEKAMERDTFMSAEQALEFGLIDKIIDKKI